MIADCFRYRIDPFRPKFPQKNTTVENISPNICFDPGVETDAAGVFGQALQTGIRETGSQQHEW